MELLLIQITFCIIPVHKALMLNGLALLNKYVPCDLKLIIPWPTNNNL